MNKILFNFHLHPLINIGFHCEPLTTSNFLHLQIRFKSKRDDIHYRDEMKKFKTATDIVPSVSIMFVAFDRNWPKITSFKNDFTFI